MTITELRELTDRHFEFVIPAADGHILFAGPLPEEYGKDLPHIPTDGSSLNLDETGLYAWEDAWAKYIASLPPKKRNRTRKQAEKQGAITEVPKQLAIPTLIPYQDAIFNLEQQDRQQQPADILSRKEYLELWGLLEILKTDFEQKARTAAQRGDDIGDKASAEYLRQAAATRTMQEKVNTKAMNMPE